MLLLAQGRFFDLLCSSEEASVLGAHLAHLTKPSPADLFNNEVVVEVVALLHLYEAIPFHLDLL